MNTTEKIIVRENKVLKLNNVLIREVNQNEFIGGSRAWSLSGAGVGLSYGWSYWTATSVVGGRVAIAVGQLASLVSGPVGIALGVAAGLGTAGLIYYMGTGVRFR